MDSLSFRIVPEIPEIVPGDDLPALFAGRVPAGTGVLVVAQKVVSKAEGRCVRLADVTPSERALELARSVEKDPRQVELVLRESRRVVRAVPGVLITETRHGLVCANAGVDLSNAPGDDVAILLPLDPDASAARIRQALGRGRAVIISDTFGRPWREGLVDVAIGVSGLAPLSDYTGTADRSGRELQVTVMATADQLAAAAGLLMRKDAGTPAVWVEGFEPKGSGGLGDLLRDPERDLFR
ncbi:MAG: coenzyme F420-0:L-glutamate ligase [Myxococcales bacterium]|nr:coenzyme F420-0:L-glutamate ligase [Myxococcales bacterium]